MKLFGRRKKSIIQTASGTFNLLHRINPHDPPFVKYLKRTMRRPAEPTTERWIRRHMPHRFPGLRESMVARSSWDDGSEKHIARLKAGIDRQRERRRARLDRKRAEIEHKRRDRIARGLMPLEKK